MEVLDASEAVLSNYEVLEFLREEKERLTSGQHVALSGRGSQVATLMMETLRAMEATPAAEQDEQKVNVFLNRLAEGGFDLSKSERLMLLNHRPANELEVHLLVEESEERLGDVKVQQILDIVKEVRGERFERNVLMPAVGLRFSAAPRKRRWRGRTRLSMKQKKRTM